MDSTLNLIDIQQILCSIALFCLLDVHLDMLASTATTVSNKGLNNAVATVMCGPVNI